MKALKNIMYYLGKYNLCERFCKTKPHNFFSSFGEFEKDVKKLYNSLKIKDFYEILKNENDFMLHFFEYFPNKN